MAIQRQSVVETALGLLDEVGIEGLTMRKLAQALNIQAPSLYWHFANKQALLDGMADALLENVAHTLDADQPWQAVIRSVAHEIRIALLAHRDGARVYAGTFVITDNVLRISDTLIGTLRNAGASNAVAVWGAFSMLYYVLGFVIEEQALTSTTTNAKLINSQREAFLNAAHEKFPHAFAAVDAIFDTDFDQRFATGIEIFLAGLESKVASC